MYLDTIFPYSFLNEIEPKLCNLGTYTGTINETGVLTVINVNKLLIEPYEVFVIAAFTDFKNNINDNIDPSAQQENDEVMKVVSVTHCQLLHIQLAMLSLI